MFRFKMNTVHPLEIVGDGSETHQLKFAQYLFSPQSEYKSPEFMNYLNIIMSIIFMNYYTCIQRVKHVSTRRYSFVGMMLADVHNYGPALPQCTVNMSFCIQMFSNMYSCNPGIAQSILTRLTHN